MITKKPTKIKEEKKEEGMVSIPQNQLDNLIKRMDSLEKDKDMLLQIADKRQLGIYYQRHREKIPTRVMLRTFNDKVILGWRTTKDEVYPDPALPTRWIEDQRLELLFEDGTSSGEIHLREFVRSYKQVEAEVRSKIIDESTGNVALKVVRLDNGKEYVIGINFVN